MFEYLCALDTLADKAKTPEIIARVNLITEMLANLCAQAPTAQAATGVRDRGPTSTREMTEDDARRIMITDLKDASHRKAAEELGLSYGQVYSARNGYTFKGVYAEMKAAAKA
jgi:hypothetical protein